MTERILGHMNKDHQLALVDYVVVDGNETLRNINTQSVRITDVSVEQLILQYESKSGKGTSLGLVRNETEDGEGVQVKSMLDIEAKLTAMAKYAAAKQGYSHKQITEVLPPTSAGSIMCYVFAAMSLATYYKKDILRSALSVVWSQNFPAVNSFLAFVKTYVVKIAVTVYVIHITEMVFIAWPETGKYRMPLRTKLAWLGFTFAEGYFHMPRLRALARYLDNGLDVSDLGNAEGFGMISFIHVRA